VRARVAVCLLLLAAAAAFALEIPPAPSKYVTDQAASLSEPDAHSLNEKLAAFEQRSGAQFIIYIFPTLDDEALEDFTIRCAEKWKVGQKKYDNGLILFVFMKERKIRIEVGYGLESTVTDAFSSRVIRDYIAPRFRVGDYAGGLNAAADALIAQIEHKEAPVPPVTRPRTDVGAAGCGGSVFALIFVIFVIIFIASLFTRSRPGCGGCFWPMFFLGGGSGRSYGGGGWGGGGGGWSGFGGGGGSFGGGGASGGW
jgi:uncharacterized protein